MSRHSSYVIKKEITATQAAYMAGIMDGEGTFYIGNYSKNLKNGDKYFQSRLVISNTDKGLIDWIYEVFGGWTREYTPKQTPKNSRKKVYCWMATTDNLLHICTEILPYLVAKKRQCEILIELRKTFTGQQNQKGLAKVQRLPRELLDHRQSLMDELRLLHNRAVNN